MKKSIEEILYNALRDLHNEQVEYITKNNLGLPHHNLTMQQALVAMTLYHESRIKNEEKAP
jgi:hypothetical protein